MTAPEATFVDKINRIIGHIATIAHGTISAQGEIIALGRDGQVTVNAGGRKVTGKPITPIESLLA